MQKHLGAMVFMISLALLGGMNHLADAAEVVPPAVSDAQPVIINVNDATREDLIGIRGIGPALADRIVAYREEHGSFTDTKELLEVTGIGEMKFEQIKQFVRV